MSSITVELLFAQLDSYWPVTDDFNDHRGTVGEFHAADTNLSILTEHPTVRKNFGYGVFTYHWSKLTLIQGSRSRDFAIAVWQPTDQEMIVIHSHCRCDYHTASLCNTLLCLAPCACCCGCLQQGSHGQYPVLRETLAYMHHNNIMTHT